MKSCLIKKHLPDFNSPAWFGLFVDVEMADWSVDLSLCEARHASGLVIRFHQAEDGLGGWLGELAGGGDLRPLTAMFPSEEPAKLVARLAREAGDVYSEAMRGRH